MKHFAASAPEGRKMTKAQKKQSADDKALNKAGLDAQAAGVRSPQGKARAKVESSNRIKPTPPHGTCFEYWEHGKCSVRSSGAACKWEHVKANSPDAKAFIAKAKAAAVKKEQADKAGGATPKPKQNIVCKYFQARVVREG